MSIRTFWSALLFLLLVTPPAVAQGGPGQGPPRIWLSGMAGLFTNMGGFSDGPNDFYQFDERELAYGGALHVDTRFGFMVGIEGLYARPGYVRYDRAQVAPINEDDAGVLAGMLSVRLSGGGGGSLGIYFAGGIGVFQWDVPDLGEKNTDFALNGLVGVEYTRFRRTPLFLEYGQWWVYHEKEDVQTNTAKHTLLRAGIRLGLL
jgi:hypothetical protein